MDYQLLDSGNGRKLEQAGKYRLIRPALNAAWPPSLSSKEWDKADGVFTRNSSGDGSWQWNTKIPESWQVNWGGLKLLTKPTSFGHLGFFAEQYKNWQWLKNLIEKSNKEIHTLNLFAYSGGSSLKMASAGSKTCHVDAAKGMISWGQENLKLNPEIPSNIRWIVDDVNKFINREVRRNRQYHGIILDPPSFGRGPQGQLWKIEDHIIPLMEVCRKLIPAKEPYFVLLSCHSPGFTPLSLTRILSSTFDVPEKIIESGEMTIPEKTGRQLPAGTFARFAFNQ